MKTRSRYVVMAIALSLVSHQAAVQAAEMATCLPQVSLPLTVRLPGSAPASATLEGGLETPLTLRDDTRRVLWSAGAGTAAIQSFPEMEAGFAGSLAAIDLDADGLHDRVYAGDLAGRLWRFDLHQGETLANWVSGGVFADFSNAEGRSFLAQPDLSLTAAAGAGTALHIGIGTAAPGNARAANRFYVLRDQDFAAAWTPEAYAQWEPLQEDDLTQVLATVDATQRAEADADGPGWYVVLGQGHVVGRSVTVNGRTVLAVAVSIPRNGPCEVFTRIAALDLVQQRTLPASTDASDWFRQLPVPLPLTAEFQWGLSADGAAALCTLGGQDVQGCTVDTRAKRSWWLRMDAP